MRYKNYKNNILNGNFGILLQSGLPTYTIMSNIKEIEIDGKWVQNSGFDLEQVKKNKILFLENRLLEIYKEKQICENNSLREKFDSLVKEQELLEQQKDEINALQ